MFNPFTVFPVDLRKKYTSPGATWRWIERGTVFALLRVFFAFCNSCCHRYYSFVDGCETRVCLLERVSAISSVRLHEILNAPIASVGERHVAAPPADLPCSSRITATSFLSVGHTPRFLCYAQGDSSSTNSLHSPVHHVPLTIICVLAQFR